MKTAYLVPALAVVFVLSFSSCSQQEAQLAVISESFNAQIDSKNSELSQERAKVEQLQTQLADANAKLREMERVVADAKKAPEFDPAELTKTVEGIVEKAVEKINARLDSGLVAVKNADKTVPVNGAVGNSATGAVIQPGVRPTERSDDPNVQRFDVTFP